MFSGMGKKKSCSTQTYSLAASLYVQIRLTYENDLFLFSCSNKSQGKCIWFLKVLKCILLLAW